MTIPVLAVWISIVIAFCLGRVALLYACNISIAFGGMSLLPPSITGGLNLPAQTICTSLFLISCLADSRIRPRLLLWALDFQKLGMLTMFCALGIAGAVILPRLFSGMISVYALNMPGSESVLYPTSANFSQMIYILISIGMAFTVATLTPIAGFLESFKGAVAAAGLMLAISGIVDFTLGSLGHENLLAGFHNASYNLLDNETIDGTKRIVGFMPEASVYAQSCCFILSFLLFNLDFYTQRERRLFVIPIIILLSVLVLGATASTGYLGLGAILSLQMLRVFYTAISKRWTSREKMRLLRGTYIFILALALVVVIVPVSLWSHLSQLLNLMVFQKASSASYIQRSSWTEAGWETFINTSLFGAGIGSVRTSNWFANIAASTGIPGLLLFSLFALGAIIPLRGSVSKSLLRLRRGTILSLIPVAMMAGVSSTTPDPGIWCMSLFGLLYGIRFSQEHATRPYRGIVKPAKPRHAQ